MIERTIVDGNPAHLSNCAGNWQTTDRKVSTAFKDIARSAVNLIRSDCPQEKACQLGLVIDNDNSGTMTSVTFLCRRAESGCETRAAQTAHIADERIARLVQIAGRAVDEAMANFR